MNARKLYRLALVIACADIVGCAYGYSLRPDPMLVVLAGFCAVIGVSAGKRLWRMRKFGVRA